MWTRLVGSSISSCGGEVATVCWWWWYIILLKLPIQHVILIVQKLWVGRPFIFYISTHFWHTDTQIHAPARTRHKRSHIHIYNHVYIRTHIAQSLNTIYEALFFSLSNIIDETRLTNCLWAYANTITHFSGWIMFKYIEHLS